jgi:uncharacterized protein (TIGR02246 family)
MTKTTVQRLVSVLLLLTAVPALGASRDEEAIKARVADFIATFNRGDAKTLSTFWVEDGTLVNPMGMTGKGPAEIEKVLASDIGGILKGTTMEMSVVAYRAVGKDAAFIELEHKVTGAKSPDGHALPPVTFHVPCLMLKQGKVWKIADSRPYAYLPPPPSGLAKK